MKKILIIFLGIALAGLTSCNKMLSESPKTFISPDNYFQTEEQMNGAMWGCFEYLMSYDGYGCNFSYYTEFLAYTKCVNNAQIAHSYNLTPGDQVFNKIWKTFYQCIGSANYIIYLLNEGKASISTEAKNCFMGEALFYRALCYFNLVRCFGEIPIVTALAQNIDDLVTPRRPIKDVYDEVIVPDLKKAIELLPIVNPYDIGRAHRISAAGLLAKVYCTMAGYPLNDSSKWQDAKDLLVTIVDSSNPAQAKAPYTNALQKDMADLYYVCSKMALNDPAVIAKRAVENGVESVFEINYNENPTYNQTGWCNFPNTNAWRQWANSAEWVYMDAPNKAGFPTDQPDYKFYLTSKDPRRYITYTTSYFTGSLSGTTIQMKYPRVYTGATQSFETNWIVMRYSELVLLLAEAENELNGPTELAKACVNAIRQRARNSTPTSLDPDSDLVDGTYPVDVTDAQAADKDTFRHYIKKEVVCEFAWEGVLYFDFVRWHELEERLVWSRDAYNRANSNDRKWPGDHVYFWPIPTEQINATNNVLTQNKGY